MKQHDYSRAAHVVPFAQLAQGAAMGSLLALMLMAQTAWAQAPSARIPIERLQREFQGRYSLLSARDSWSPRYVPWPACECGTPAPHFPPDNFYGDLDRNPALARLLVEDLATKFLTNWYGSDRLDAQPIYMYFLATADGVFKVEGAAAISNYS